MSINDLLTYQKKGFTKLQGYQTATTPAGVELSTDDYNEAFVMITSAANPLYVYTFSITSGMVKELALTTPDKAIRSGYYNSASDYTACDFRVNNSALYSAHLSVNGVDVTDLTMTVYYR